MQYVSQTPQYDASASQYGYDPSAQYQQQYGQQDGLSMYGGNDMQMQQMGQMGQMGGPAPKYQATALYSGESDREGMLLLQNTTKKALWQPRYVIVKENYLFLFKRSPMLLMRRKYPRPMSYLMNFLRKLRQEKLLKVVSLEHAEIEIAESATMRPNTFVVHHKDQNTLGKWFFAYFLAADSRQEMEDWIKYLKEQKTSHLMKRVNQVDAIFSSQLHVVTKELYEAEKEKLKIAEELIETENNLFKAMREEIECLDAEIEHVKRIKPPPMQTRAKSGPPPPPPSSQKVAGQNAEKKGEAAAAPPSIPRAVPPPVPDEEAETDAEAEAETEAGAIPIPTMEELDEESDDEDKLISNQIVVYEDEIDDDYIVGEVIMTPEETVEELRERVEEELEMEDGFVMNLNGNDLLSITNSHKVYKYLEVENVLVLQY